MASERAEQRGFVALNLFGFRRAARRRGFDAAERFAKNFRRDAERVADQNHGPSVIARVGFVAASDEEFDLRFVSGLDVIDKSGEEQGEQSEGKEAFHIALILPAATFRKHEVRARRVTISLPNVALCNDPFSIKMSPVRRRFFYRRANAP